MRFFVGKSHLIAPRLERQYTFPFAAPKIT